MRCVVKVIYGSLPAGRDGLSLSGDDYTRFGQPVQESLGEPEKMMYCNRLTGFKELTHAIEETAGDSTATGKEEPRALCAAGRRFRYHAEHGNEEKH